SSLAAELGKYGFRVKNLSRRQVHEQQLDEEFIKIRTAYNTVRDEVYASGPMMEKKKASTITNNVGPAAIDLGNKTNSDVILLVDYMGSIKTNGARARDFAISLLIGTSALLHDADSARIVIGIIDAKTGKVLWANWLTHSEDLYSSMLSNTSSQEKMESKRLQQIMTNLLDPLKDKKDKK
ncbi:MAG: hypothetical protein K2Q33_02650, partial [Gammaproteobacteria bacterium]|nr:hypothetical protein [Gammaproteobacteria bacterium]